MRLNLKECEHRKFDDKNGEIFCNRDCEPKLIEDCIACMAEDDSCEKPIFYTEFQINQISKKFEDRIRKAERQRDINFILAVLILICWMLFELYDKIE